MGYYYPQQIRTQCARLERTATGSWITIHWRTIQHYHGLSPEYLPASEPGGFTDDQWDCVVAELYPGWELVLCGDDIN
jgi:hypothetical protein